MTPTATVDSTALKRAAAEITYLEAVIANTRYDLEREIGHRRDLVAAIRRAHDDDPTHRDAWIWCDEAACRAAREAAP